MKMFKYLLLSILLILSGCSTFQLNKDELDTVNKQWVAAETAYQSAIDTVDSYVSFLSTSQKATLADAILTVKKVRTSYNTYKKIGDITNAKNQVELLRQTTSMLRNQLIKELIREKAKQESEISSLQFSLGGVS